MSNALPSASNRTLDSIFTKLSNSYDKNKKGKLHGYEQKGLLLCKIKIKLLRCDLPVFPVRLGTL